MANVILVDSRSDLALTPCDRTGDLMLFVDGVSQGRAEDFRDWLRYHVEQDKMALKEETKRWIEAEEAFSAEQIAFLKKWMIGRSYLES